MDESLRTQHSAPVLASSHHRARIQGDSAKSISSTLDSPPYFFDYLPFVFIIDTSTMEIVAADSGGAVNPINVDILEVLQQIDGAS